MSASSISRGTVRLATPASGRVEQRLGLRELAHVDGGARAEQRGQPARLRHRERFVGELARLAVAAFEQRDDRRILLAARALDVAAAPALAHLRRHPRDARREAQQQVQHDEPGDERAR